MMGPRALSTADCGLRIAYRNGTTGMLPAPLDRMARLAAMVAPPRLQLSRFLWVFTLHSMRRAAVTPAHRGEGTQGPGADQEGQLGPSLTAPEAQKVYATGPPRWSSGSAGAGHA